MATTPKPKTSPTTSKPAAVKPTAKPVSGKPAAAGEKDFVHFSDKLTDTLEDVTKSVEENKAIIDTVQELGIDLSHTIASLAVTAVKYAKMVDSMLDMVVPVLDSIPLVPQKTVDFLNKVRSLADKIVNTCETSQRIAGDVEGGLTRGDVNKLKEHSGELKNVVTLLRDILPDTTP
jgi:hypothetical protein